MTIKEKQYGLAEIANERGLIDAQLANSIKNAKASHEIIETLFSLIAGENIPTLQTFLARMVQYER